MEDSKKDFSEGSSLCKASDTTKYALRPVISNVNLGLLTFYNNSEFQSV